MRFRHLGSVFAGLLMFAAAPALARPAAMPFFPAGAVADAPAGFVEMCARDTELCRAGHDASLVTRAIGKTTPAADCAASPLAWPLVPTFSCDATSMMRPTATIRVSIAAFPPMVAAVERGIPSVATGERKLIRRINSNVNRFTMQVSDFASTGQDELWTRAIGSGDCEDLAIEKRVRLIEAGFDPSRLFFAVAYRSGFGLHTVLIARMEDGDQVLDSLSPHVLPWSKTRYSWLRLQSPDNPMVWTRIGRPAAQMARAGDTTARS